MGQDGAAFTCLPRVGRLGHNNRYLTATFNQTRFQIRGLGYAAFYVGPTNVKN